MVADENRINGIMQEVQDEMALFVYADNYVRAGGCCHPDDLVRLETYFKDAPIFSYSWISYFLGPSKEDQLFDYLGKSFPGFGAYVVQKIKNGDYLKSKAVITLLQKTHQYDECYQWLYPDEKQLKTLPEKRQAIDDAMKRLDEKYGCSADAVQPAS
jgi:hypothetical protein